MSTPQKAGESALTAMRRRAYPAFVAPALMIYGVIQIVPMVFSTWTGFYAWNGVGPMTWVGIQNYVRILRDPVFLRSLWNTMLIVVVVGAGVFAVSFALTIILQNTFGRKPIRIVIFFPTLVPPIVISILWGFLFNPDGLLNKTLGAVGITDPPPWLGSGLIFPTIMLGLLWLSVGMYAIILLAATDRIPTDLYEVADLAGAGPLQRFRYVTLPLMWDIVSVTVVLWCVGALKTFEFLLTFSSATGTLPSKSIWNIAIYSYAEAFPPHGAARFGSAAASGVVMLLLAMILAVLAMRLMRRRDEIEY